MGNTTNCRAEEKLRKFREPLTGNADGNPEPSPGNREGAETRHGVCLVCDELITGKQKTAKYCSRECRRKSRRKPKAARFCKKCENSIPDGLNSNATFCSSRCRAAYHSINFRVKAGAIKNPGVGSGGAQWGKSNHRYKTGIGSYSKKVFDAFDNSCKRCGSTDKSRLLVHHVDHDRTNNELNNLEILCKKCHQSHHYTRDEITGRFISKT
jgi:hypothetical protein